MQAWAKTVGPSEPNAGAGLGHDGCEHGLANLKHIAPQVVAIQLDQVEGVQERAVIMAAVAVLVGRHGAMNPAGRVRCNIRTK